MRGHHGKAPPATLFERIGGLTVVDTAVDLLHRRGDPDLSPFRAGVDLARLPGLQVEFIAKTRRFSDLSSGDIGVDGRAGAGIRDRRPEPFRQTDR